MISKIKGEKIMKKFIRQSWLVCLLLISSQIAAVSGPINEPSPLSIISFKSYQEVESFLQGQILSRTFRVELSNDSAEELTNVRLLIDGAPDYVTILQGELYLGNISSGKTVISSQLIELTIDIDQVEENYVNLIWQVQCEVGGNDIFDETSVVEIIK